MTIGATKRKLEERIDDVDGLTETIKNSKKLKYSEIPEQDDGGAKSTTETEPDSTKTIVMKRMTDGITMDFNKILLLKVFIQT